MLFKNCNSFVISVGASVQRPAELKFLYENHEDFQVIPTFYVLPAMQTLFGGSFENVVPGKQVSLEKILHGEQYIEIVGDVPQDGKLFSRSKVVEVLDKGSGAVIVNNGK